MRKTLVLLSVIVVAGTASAASAKLNHAKTSSAHITANKTGTATGACSTTGYSSHCPSDNCECDEFFGFVNGNQAGRGTATLKLTVDNGSSTSSPGCKPVFGVATLNGLKDNNQELAITGAECDGKNANSKHPLNGGYGIDASDAGIGGAGTLSGNITSGGKMDLKLSGFIEPF